LNACHLNLLQGIEPFGLTEEDILHNLNIHQKARIDPTKGRTLCTSADSKPGDYIEFFAEIDVLVSVSVCPNGDGLLDATEPEKVTLRPIGIGIYDTGISPKEFPGWTDWRPTWRGKWEPPKL